MKKWMIVLGILVAVVAFFSLGSVTMAKGPEWGQGLFGSEFRGGPADSPISILADMAGVSTDEIISKLQEGKSLAEVAKSYGVAATTLIDKVVAAHTERLQTLVDDGRITQEQADSRIQTMRDRVTEQINTVWSEDLKPPRPMDGERMGAGMGRGDAPGMGKGNVRGEPADSPISILANEAGVTASDIMSALQEGKSLADVAKSYGVAVESLIDKVVAAHTERLQTLVDDGRITQEQADSRIKTMRERVTEQINTVRTKDDTMPRRGMPRGGAGAGGFGPCQTAN